MTDKEDIKDGLVEEFYDNGLLSFKGNYKNGKEDGLWELFHENGQLGSRWNYKNGQEEGLFVSFYDNGQLKHRENYIDGELDGLYETFHEKGKLYETFHKNGKPDGHWETFYLNSNFFLHGPRKTRGKIKNEKLEGLWEYFDEEGNLTKTEEYKDGELVE